MAYVQTKHLKNLNIRVHAVDTLSKVTRLAVCVRAGSRYEPDDAPGVAHYVKSAAGLTTQGASMIAIRRLMERAGAAFKVSMDRENIIYRVDCLKDKVPSVLGFIDDTINRPEFRSWELYDLTKPFLKDEIKSYRSNLNMFTNEAMHKAAYRGGLAHPVIMPEHQVEKITRSQLFDYVNNNFVLDTVSVTGLGIEEGELRNMIEDNFKFNESSYAGVSGASRYVGGEARIQANFSNTQVNFVVQGSSMADFHRLAALEIIGNILGGPRQTNIKYGSGVNKSIAHALAGAAESKIINVSHSDTGLFGFSLVGSGAPLRNATKTAVKHVRKVLGEITEADVSGAKKSLKSRALVSSEDNEAVFNYMVRSHSCGIPGQSALGLVEKLTLKDVQGVAASLLKCNPTMTAVGNPRFVPYVDELD